MERGGGRGQVKFHVVSRGGGGGGSLDLDFVRRWGSSKNWMVDRTFSRPPWDLDNERSLMSETLIIPMQTTVARTKIVFKMYFLYTVYRDTSVHVVWGSISFSTILQSNSSQPQCGMILYESCQWCFMKELQVLYDFLNQYKAFCGFSMGRNQYWAGRVYDLCVYYMTGTPEGSKQQKIPNENYYLFEKIQKFSEH